MTKDPKPIEEIWRLWKNHMIAKKGFKQAPSRKMMRCLQMPEISPWIHQRLSQKLHAKIGLSIQKIKYDWK